MKTDAQLKSEIEAELAWEPSINAAHVGVAVDEGVVTLTGHLETFTEKFAIDRVVSRVAGVRAVAVELDVKLAAAHVRSDTGIAASAEDALKWNTMVPFEQIRTKVEKGWVTLSGEVEWEFQRRAAEAAVHAIRGVRSVVNLVTLKPRSAPDDIATRIADALKRRAQREARDVHVAMSGGVVTLRGRVHSIPERDAACGAALAAPGVAEVVDELTVGV
jgi:osmotically-inducible protein OsmY